jgi:hypothetical protein
MTGPGVPAAIAGPSWMGWKMTTGPSREALLSAEKLLDTLRLDMGAMREWFHFACIGREFINLLGGSAEIAARSNGGTYTIKADGVSAVREDLLDALASLNGNEPKKKCMRCREFKTLRSFYVDRHNKKDGRWRYCNECEQKRAKDNKARRRGAL